MILRVSWKQSILYLFWLSLLHITLCGCIVVCLVYNATMIQIFSASLNFILFYPKQKNNVFLHFFCFEEKIVSRALKTAAFRNQIDLLWCPSSIECFIEIKDFWTWIY